MTRFACCSCVALGWLALTASAHAAGGHFDVDDAALAEPGYCQYETWWTRAPAELATGVHLGSACRVGPVELGLNYDRLTAAATTRSLLGPQVKWVAGSPDTSFSAGLVWSAARDLQQRGRPAHILYVPLTWVASDRIALNADFGADWDRTGARTRRLGVSAEWVAHEKLTVIGERVTFAGDWASRIGLRWRLGDAISVDLSAARVGPSATAVYAIGLNHDFTR